MNLILARAASKGLAGLIQVMLEQDVVLFSAFPLFLSDIYLLAFHVLLVVVRAALQTPVAVCRFVADVQTVPVLIVLLLLREMNG